MRLAAVLHHDGLRRGYVGIGEVTADDACDICPGNRRCGLCHDPGRPGAAGRRPEERIGLNARSGLTVISMSFEARGVGRTPARAPAAAARDREAATCPAACARGPYGQSVFP